MTKHLRGNEGYQIDPLVFWEQLSFPLRGKFVILKSKNIVDVLTSCEFRL